MADPVGIDHSRTAAFTGSGQGDTQLAQPLTAANQISTISLLQQLVLYVAKYLIAQMRFAPVTKDGELDKDHAEICAAGVVTVRPEVAL